MLRLYYMRNTCALASHIALEQAGASYEAVRVDFASSEQRKPEYLAINPKGRVPALVTERGILTETPAILVFIAQSFPKAGLAPLDDPFALAQAQAFNSYLCSTVHVAHAHRMRGYALAMREERAKALGIRALGDLAKHPELKLGLSQEFIGRKDGWPEDDSKYFPRYDDPRRRDSRSGARSCRARCIRAGRTALRLDVSNRWPIINSSTASSV